MTRSFALALLLSLSAAAAELVNHTPDQFLPQAHGVTTRLVGTRATESVPAKTNPAVDTLVVPPYLDIIVFDIFGASPGAAVEIVPPHSTEPIRAGADGIESVFIGDVLATLVVPRPEPGEWIIRKSRADARVFPRLSRARRQRASVRRAP